jgi:hypothetical protein
MFYGGMGFAPLERFGMRLMVGLFLIYGGMLEAWSLEEPSSSTTMVLVMGAPGAAEFEEQFQRWSVSWEQAAKESGAALVKIGFEDSFTAASASLSTNGNDLEVELAVRPVVNELEDRERLRTILREETEKGGGELWLVLIGHGTFDGRQAKFNLRGPDFSAAELAQWLQDARRPLVVINCASSSGPFINALSGSGRVIITATKSGYEQNFARFGKFLSEAILNPEADLDKDGQVSILEAFLTASRELKDFYEAEGRLATEHPLLDDNGDGLGTPGDWFRGIRPVKKPSEGGAPDGLRAHQFHLIRTDRERNMLPEIRERRDALEMKIARLREAKGKLGEDVYYEQLEELLLEVATLYESVESSGERERAKKRKF